MVACAAPIKGSSMKNVLIVDDSLMAQEIISSELRDSFRVKIILASDTTEALSILANNIIDLVICDFEMPDGNGDIVLNYVRNNDLSMPFIFFTGNFELNLPIQKPLIEIVNDKNYGQLFSVICRLELCEKRDHAMPN